MEGIDGGLHPAVDKAKVKGETGKTKDRGQWKTLMEGYILDGQSLGER